jgi:hypothetical protein
VETADPPFELARGVLLTGWRMQEFYLCNMLKMNRLFGVPGHLHPPSGVRGRWGTLFTFAQICSRRITKEYCFLCLYSWDRVYHEITAQGQNNDELGPVGSGLGPASGVLTHPYAKSIVKLRWLKPRGGTPAVMRP